MIELGRFDRLVLETLIDGRLVTRQLLQEFGVPKQYVSHVFHCLSDLHNPDLEKVWIVTRMVNGVQTIECRKAANKGCIYGYALKDRLDSAWDLERMSGHNAHLKTTKIEPKGFKRDYKSSDMKVISCQSDVISMYTSKFAEERALRTQKRLELIEKEDENQVKKPPEDTDQIMKSEGSVSE